MAADPTTETTRRRGDKRERTRTALLDAALAQTRETGFEQTTLAQIAARAGMTTGAIYGNFKNREALFMALAERQWAPVRPRFRLESSFAEKMRAVAEAVITAIAERRASAVGALTFRAYVLQHEDARLRYRDAMARGYDTGAAWFHTLAEADDLPMPPEVLVRVINVLIEGLLFQSFLTPELMPDEVVYAAFGALAGKTAATT